MSKYCDQCGCELPDSAEFCRECGAPQKKKSNRNMIIIIGLVALIAVLLFIFIQSMPSETDLEILTQSMSVTDGFSVRLTSAGSPVSNEKIQITFSDSKRSYDFEGTTDASGTVTVTPEFSDGEYNVICAFEGDGKYNPSKAEGSLSVEPDYMSYSFNPTFGETDSDGDGYVTLTDFNFGHTPEDVSTRIFEDSDDDNNGKLDMGEYHKFMYKLNYERTEYGLDDVKLPV